MSDVDSLQIGIVADCSKAEQEIDKLVNKMLLLQKTMFSLGNTKMNIAPATNIVNGNNNIINNIQRIKQANQGFQSLFNTINSGSRKSNSGIKSLTSSFFKMSGVLYLFKKFTGGISSSIKYASDLVEVQNVVDNVFGDATQKVEDFSKNSIKNFGMSKLTTKEIASEYQAMANAMGITNEQVQKSNSSWSLADTEVNKTADAYNNAAGSVADMSLNLTKLAADMGSFYNKDYKDIGSQIASGVLSGQSRSLRAYGLDLTQATLKEFAMSQGLNSNVKDMTQAEKTMLRYQYVMAHTKNIQGDFLRTSMSWSNVVRVLGQNFQDLGATIGGIGINAFRPLLIGINNAILKLNEFAIVVSNSLGKIFGWKYVGGGGSASTELEDMADSADGLAGGLGNAADNAKKLKSQLQGFDQLNVLSSDSGNGSGGSGSGGASGGSGGASSSNNGGWERTESLFDSDLDTLGKLGSYISDKLANSLESIDWDSIYQGARNFGKGLADFLNGLITPRLFYDTGMTIASSLNTAIYGSLEFAENFDFRNFGSSIASAINGFFQNFDFGALAETLNVWVDGIEDTIAEAVNDIEWKNAFSKIGEFLGSLDADTWLAIIGIANFAKMKSGFKSSITKNLNISGLVITISGVSLSYTNAKEGDLADSLIADVMNGIGATMVSGSWKIGAVSLIISIIGSVLIWDRNTRNEKGQSPIQEIFSNIKDRFTLPGSDTSMDFNGNEITLKTTLSWKIKTIKWDIEDAFDSFTKAVKTGWKKFWLDMAYDASEMIQPLLDKIADIGEATGLMKEETVENLRGFHDGVAEYVNKSKQELDGYKNKTQEVNNTTKITTSDMSGLYAGWYGNMSRSLQDSRNSLNNYENSVNQAKNTTSTSTTNMSGLYAGWYSNMSNSLQQSRNALNGYETSMKNARGTTSTETSNMSNLYAGWYSNMFSYLGQSKNSLAGYEGALKGAKNTTSTETTNISNLYSGLYRNISSNMSAGSTSVKNLGDENTKTKGKVDDLMKKSNQTFNIKTGSGFSSLSKVLSGITGGLSSIFGYSGKTLNLNLGKKAEGGAYYDGTWHAIPQYASGGSPSHGTMFIAGERGAEAVGHINGRTEVLNQSQMASVMYDAVLSGMSAAMARQGTNRVEVVLQGDAKGIFNVVRKEDRQYKNQNGHSAFGY